MSEQFFAEKSKKYISSRDAARLYGVTHDYISRLCRQGKLNGILDGRKWMVDASALQTFFAAKGAVSQELYPAGDDLISSKEAAKIYRVTNDYIARLCKQGKLEGTLRNRNWQVKRSSLALFFVSRPAYEDTTKALPIPSVPVYKFAPKKSTAPVPEKKTTVEGTASKRYFTFAAATAALSLLFVFGTFAMPRPQANSAGTASVWSGLTSAMGDLHDYFFGKAPTPLATSVTPKPVAPAVTNYATTTQLQTIVQQKTYPVTERTVERVLTVTGLSADDIDAKISIANNKLRAEVYSQLNSAPGNTYGGGGSIITNQALGMRIDKLENVTLTNVTFAGTINGLTASNISGLPGPSGSSASSTLLADINTFSGSTIFNGGATISSLTLGTALSIANGGTGTSTAPSYGQLLLGNSAGGYDLVATSSLGIVGNGTGSSTFGTTSIFATAPLSWNTTTATLSITQSGIAGNGYLSSTDFNTFNNKIASSSLSALYPLAYNSGTGVFTTAFGTTTANTYSSLNTFNGGIIANAATTTSLAISNVTSSLLKTLSNGAVVAAVAGTDYQAAGNYATFAYPFPGSATTTSIAFNGGFTFTNATGTSFAVTGTASTTNLIVSSLGASAGQCLTTTSSGSVISTSCGSVGSSFPFTPSTFGATASNATSTLIGFTNGLYATASSTFTSTLAVVGNAIFNSSVGIGTTTPYRALSIVGTTTSTGGFNVDSNTNLLSYLGSTTISVLGTRNFFAGLQANGSTTKTTGTDSVFIGSSAGAAVTGSNNIYIGSGAGVGSTTGAANSGGQNTVVGRSALQYNSTGQYNNAFGYQAMYANETGSANSAFGDFALGANKSGSNNAAFGGQALFQSSGNENVAVGYNAGYNNTSGSNNVLVGRGAGYTLTTGSGNTLIGDNKSQASQITTGFGNIGLGSNVFFPDATANSQINIGNILFGAAPATSTGFRLPTSGSIGVGTSSPFAKFAIGTNNGDTATTLFAIGSSTQSATSTLFSISNTGSTTLFQLNSSLLKTNANGTIVAAVAGTDYLTSATIWAYPFTPSTFGATASNATSTLIGFTNGLYATASSTFTSTLAVVGNAIFNSSVGIGTSSPYSALSVTGTTTSTGGFNVDGNTNLLSYLGSTTISVLGTRNFFAGLQANGSTTKTTGSDNVFIGANAGSAVTGIFSVYIGSFSGQGSTTGAPNTANSNTAVGYRTLQFNSTGSNNAAFGSSVLQKNTTGSWNSAFGAESGGGGTMQNNTIGSFNGAFGVEVLFSNTSGNNNNGFGYDSLFNNTTGSNNSAFGRSALQANTTGSNNSAFGYQAGISVTTGYSNILIGDVTTSGAAAGNISTGFGNVGLGASVYFPSATANSQLNIGNLLFGSLPATSTGFRLPTSGSFGVGTSSPFAKFSIATNNGDTATTLFAIGSSTATATSTLFSISNTGSTTASNGFDITAGCYAVNGTCLSTGGGGAPFPFTPTNNFGVTTNATSTILSLFAGVNASSTSNFANLNVYGQLKFASALQNSPLAILANGNSFITASSSGFNTSVGEATLGKITSGIQNSAFGYQAMQNATSSSSNNAFGYQALMCGGLNCSGNDNNAFGSGALSQNGSGFSNNAFGGNALASNVSGFGNVAVGNSVLQFATSSVFNTAVGYTALQGNFNNSSGGGNSAFGNASLQNNGPGSLNTAIGNSAMQFNYSGGSNLALGTNALGNATSTSNNIAVGFAALTMSSTNASGFNNLGVGYNAGYNLSSGSKNALFGFQAGYNLSTGSSNILIGYSVDAPSNTGNQQLNIGNVLYGSGIYDGSSGILSTPVLGGSIGIGTTTPFAKLSIQANFGETAGTLFAIGSSTSVNATSTLFSVSNTGSTTLFRIPSSILKTNSNGTIVAAVAGTDYITGDNLASAYPFALTGNATSTLTQFNGGLTAYASSTIGNGTQAGGLTISGGATTTGTLTFTDTGSEANRTVFKLGNTSLLVASSTGFNVGLGVNALSSLTSGNVNTAVGAGSLALLTTGINNVAIGWRTLGAVTGDIGNTAIGSGAMLIAVGGVNTAIGAGALRNNAGWDNVAIGAAAGINQVSGDGNILIGDTVDAPNLTGSYQLNIGNLIYGTHVGFGSTFSSSNVGIGTSSPLSTLSIQKTYGSFSTNLFSISSSTNSTGTTNTSLFSISNTGSTTLFQIPSSILKTDSNGTIVAAVAGTDYLTSATIWAYPFTPTTAFGTAANATGTLIGFTNGLYALASSTIGGGTLITGLTISGGATTTGSSTVMGQILASDGTAGAPGIAFSGAPTTGITRLGNFTTGLVVSGSTFAAFGSNGSGYLAVKQSSLLGFANSTTMGNGQGLDTAFSRLAANKLALGNGTASDITGTLILGTLGVGTSSPFAKFAVQANNGDTNLTLFAIGSSTQSATTTLFAVTNTGNILSKNINGGIYIGNSYSASAGSGGVVIGNGANSASSGNTATAVVAIGNNAAQNNNSTFSHFVVIGDGAMSRSSANNNSVAIGSGAASETTGAENVAIGKGALSGTFNNSANFNVAVGQSALTVITGGTNNVAIGYQSGSVLSTGYGNIFVGSSQTSNNITTGFNNLMIGNNSFAPAAASSNFLNLGGLLFGTLPATTTALQLPTTGSFGVGSSSPFAKFAIATNNGDTATMLFAIGSSTQSATSTLFSVSNTGSTTLFQLTSSLLKADSNGTIVAAVAGTDYINGTGLASAFPFTPTTAFGTAANATGTLIGFTNGLYALASSTIGNGTQAGGLTISGGATTTGNAYIAGSMVIGAATTSGGMLTIAPSTFPMLANIPALLLGTSSLASAGSGGTYIAVNAPSAFNGTGNAGKFIEFQKGGSTQFWVTATGAVFAGGSMSAASYGPTASGQTLNLNGNGSSWAGGIAAISISGNIGQSNTVMSNTSQDVLISNSSAWGPNAGSSVFNDVEMRGINFAQTGTANGISRLLYLNPTSITTAADFRVLETSAYNFNLKSSTTTLQGALFNQFSISSSTAATVTNAFGLQLMGAPIAAANVTITNAAGLQITGGAVNGGGTVTNASGLIVNAPTGASKNYAAQFLGGNVGIGTTSPFAKLSIAANNGDTATALFAIGSSTQSATTTLFSVANTGDVTVNGSSGTTCTIGNGVGGTSCTSDSRLKANVVSITGTDALAKLSAINGVTFNWIDQSKNQQQFVGVIAQEVQKQFPQVVSSTAGGFLEVDYSALVAPLISGVNELNTRTQGLGHSTSSVTISSGTIVYSNFATSTIAVGYNVWTIATSSATGTQPIISISAPASSTPSVSINGALYINGVDVGASVASSSATTTPEVVTANFFAAATDGLKSAISSALTALQNIAQLGVRNLGAAVYATVGTFNNLFTQTLTADSIKTKELCIDDVCVNKTQLQNLLNGQNTAQAATTPPPATEVTPPATEVTPPATSTPDVAPPAAETVTPPATDPAPIVEGGGEPAAE